MTYLAELTAEVEKVNREKGWYDEPRSFGDLIALLHSEVSEMLEAFRNSGFGVADATDYEGGDSTLPKPEGVGAEAADVLIRLVDLCARCGIDLEDWRVEVVTDDTFGDWISYLHVAISSLAQANTTGRSYWTNVVLMRLRAFCTHYGIDLEAETERKLAYNRTRSHRHGAKRL